VYGRDRTWRDEPVVIVVGVDRAGGKSVGEYAWRGAIRAMARKEEEIGF
jgi:hypothetical protein